MGDHEMQTRPLGRAMLSALVGTRSEVERFTSVVADRMRLDELAPIFGRRRATRWDNSYETYLAAVQKKRILDASGDVIILTRGMMDDLAKQNKLAPGNIVHVAGSPVALAQRGRTPKAGYLDQRTRSKQTLLSDQCRSPIADPAKGGRAGGRQRAIDVVSRA